uniref:Uncharacterized protein n=1 Tax=Setaria italica TaxID=4555 RepID=K4A3Q7_SETIT
MDTWLTDQCLVGGESAGCWKDRGRRHHVGRAGPRRPPRLETRTPTHARASWGTAGGLHSTATRVRGVRPPGRRATTRHHDAASRRAPGL